MSGEDRVRRYNHLLELADTLLATPSLVLNRKSALRQHLEEFSPEALEYFEPEEVPEWVDEAKLETAATLWKDNSIAAVGVLYAYSLPCAYLYKDGVPTLYDTGKLAENQYIFQRIYETGIFVDAVMDEDGIEIMEDFVPRQDGDKSASRRSQPRRYMWGRGFLAARKVRFLHASIRCMITKWRGGDAPEGHDGRHSGAGWKDQGGKPAIAQKELALVLLTFGYLIPQGLERWGARLTQEQKDAFLHHWRLVGHIMGINDDFMTDDWDEAEALVAAILKDEAAPSPMGEKLTVALMSFLREYLPHLTAGLRDRVPADLIVSQLGKMDPAYPPMILPTATYKGTQRLLPRLTFGALMLWVRLYYWVRDRFIGRIPLLGETLMSTLHQAAEELIESWRGEFRRRPFDVSRDIAWKPGGSNPDLMKWRRRIFNNVAFAIVLLFLAVAGLVGAVVVAFLPVANTGSWLEWLLGGSVVSGVLAWMVMSWRLPRVFARRPKADLTQGTAGR
jgi:hypothetical protein